MHSETFLARVCYDSVMWALTATICTRHIWRDQLHYEQDFAHLLEFHVGFLFDSDHALQSDNEIRGLFVTSEGKDLGVNMR